ncbi:PWWP domain-containing protein 2A isoform X2 [Esox lucius]|uniref:PWWP domain containing 2A n=1 Tax=Esox lucius TaxID=8010 RepID=A0AAY5K619_ESOLU|nr:PWWP domain-containing protein 2A isoform X2 [Esox lucius]
MAAVAAEPGAATASTTTTGDGGELEPAPAVPGAKLDSSATQDYAPVMDLVPQSNDGDAVQECSQVQMELVSRPDLEAAGKALAASSEDEHIQTSCLGVGVENAENHALEGCGSKHTTMSRAERLRQFFSPNVEPANEVSKHEPYACLQNSSISDTQPSVVFLHSFPAHPVATEAGLSIAEPAEPMIDYCQNPELTQPTNVASDYRALIKTTHEAELESEPADDVPPGSEYKEESSEDASLERSEYTEQVDSIPVLERETVLGTPMETGYICDFSSITDQNSPSPELPVISLDQVPSAELGDSRSPQRRLEMKFNKSDQVSKPPPPLAGGETEEVQSESVDNLIPGSEVRVSLDHIIDDALVVSFRLGEKIFSGVLMDLSKRFGPYGIPITVFPKREYKDKPESMQLMAEPLQQDPEKVEQPVQENPDCPIVTAAEPNTDPQPEINQWTSKPPPLFQEGAPYPPPLFIRDTYNQSLPQPPPRKIKRPKRRLYREEPTSIMNAIKLRPRQVLCDKCKGAVATVDKREPRRGPLSDSRGDDARRRRNDGSAPVSKRPRNEPRSEEKGRGSAEASKRQASGIRQVSSSSLAGQVKGGAGANRVLRASSAAAASSSSSSPSSLPSNSNPRVQLGAKKVLQSKSVDHSKAREVLKMAKAQKRQRETTVVSGNAKTMTRAAALQEAHAHQKVHFTRRLQQISGVGPSSAPPLPPRMRIKPQSATTLKGF